MAEHTGDGSGVVDGNYHFEKSVLDNMKVIKLLDQAIKQNKGFSLARFGIGEISYLSYPADYLYRNSNAMYLMREYPMHQR
ncbi:MAG: hypothetical protein ACQEW5_10840 [Bacillota bacterium]